MLTAIGHDLRTPITRLKLRAEFVEDDEQRGKILADLEELEAMVSATLAFGRDARTTEPVSHLDLAELLRTILDEAGDANPDVLDKLNYEGPAHLTVQARSLALKRVFVNLVANAVNYGGSATVRLVNRDPGMVVVEVEDDGPGIPPVSWIGCSSRSIAGNRAATERRAGLGWGCRSLGISCGRMAGT